MPDQDQQPPRRRPLAAVRSWPRWARISTYVACGLALALVVGVVTTSVLVRRPLPQTTGTAELTGLDAAVEVVRDEHGVPQVYADSLTDLVMAQGYVHAQERFFEMDVRRHATAGRLAEMFGESALDSDKAVRTMGWRRVAERELAIVSPRTRQVLEAYADGVNAYLADRSPSELAVEYTVLNASGLGYRPEDWSPVDSLAWLKAMAWDLRGNMGEEVDRALTAAAVGRQRAEELWPAYPFDEHAPIVGQGAVVDGVFQARAETGGTRLPQRPGWTAALRSVRAALDAVPSWLGRGDGIGSNSWVVDGEHSETGEPLLANDPHLGASMPGVWMQMGLHCRTVSEACPLEVAGFTFSGVPGVVIGHNADIAWGFTNLGPDVTDLYLERVVGDGYRYDGEVLPLRVRTETIEVRGADPVTIEVRATRHGPLLSDVDEDIAAAGDGQAVALAWTALEPSATADAILAMNAASDWDSFREAAASFAVPAQNLVYADRAGHIGYQAPGVVPVRKSGNDGRWPAEGWRAEDDWTGETVPFDGLPSVLDPDEGFVVTANQAVIGPDYPYALTQDWDRGYRSQRIRDLLAAAIEADGGLSVEEMLEVQRDDRNPMAATLVPYLLDIDLPRGYASDGQRLLAGWDGSQPADSAAAAYYNVVWRTLLEHTFHDELPEEVRPDGGQRWFAVVSRLLGAPEDRWWDDVTTDGVVEDRDDVLRRALLEARDELTRLQSLHPEDWSWGGLHSLELRSPTLGESGIGPVEALVNRGDWELGGGSSIVDATGWDAAEGYAVTSVPSMRMVVSLADLDASRWINLTGVSGHPASGHYTDQTDLWARGETIAWPFSPAAVEDAAADVLRLEPARTE
ncbi:penicillin acylase family protein [Nocardioides marmotae]|uniref:penicillin acylase family protein n=1 Tax=Nocardioides marmotae TaxID=2663857 RepID=UPI0012B55DBB|nr:penicillin acylase family protein [Nocardioides marmotae]MBC9734480.1 penicillin acylase family protein [Nocardioides marmotae]MTB85580.1 penicillin acylase family protein [Nocardioides marmotae]